MQAESLEVLEKASVAPAQARAIVRAIEIELAGAATTLATKHDVASNLCAEIARVGGQLRADIRCAFNGYIRQMYVALLAQTALTLTFIYILFAEMS